MALHRSGIPQAMGPHTRKVSLLIDKKLKVRLLSFLVSILLTILSCQPVIKCEIDIKESEKAGVLAYLSFHFSVPLEYSCAKIHRKMEGMQKEHQSPGVAQGKSDPTLHLLTPHARREPLPVTVSFLRFHVYIIPSSLGYTALKQMFQRERPKASLLRNGCSRISVRFQNQMFIMVYFILIILPAFSPTLRVSLSLRWWHCCTICGTQYSFLCKILECILTSN